MGCLSVTAKIYLVFPSAFWYLGPLAFRHPGDAGPLHVQLSSPSFPAPHRKSALASPGGSWTEGERWTALTWGAPGRSPPAGSGCCSLVGDAERASLPDSLWVSSPTKPWMGALSLQGCWSPCPSPRASAAIPLTPESLESQQEMPWDGAVSPQCAVPADRHHPGTPPANLLDSSLHFDKTCR